jgi:hypothetical protein
MQSWHRLNTSARGHVEAQVEGPGATSSSAGANHRTGTDSSNTGCRPWLPPMTTCSLHYERACVRLGGSKGRHERLLLTRTARHGTARLYRLVPARRHAAPGRGGWSRGAYVAASAALRGGSCRG